MFVRVKGSGKYQYLQVVHNKRVNGKVRQEVIATLGRFDVLMRTGQIDGLIASCARFADHVAVLDTQTRGKTPGESIRIKKGRSVCRRHAVLRPGLSGHFAVSHLAVTRISWGGASSLTWGS